MIDYLNRQSRKSITHTGLLVLCVLLSACNSRVNNKIIARVNDEQILMKELSQRLQEYQFDPSLNTAEKNFELKKTILNELIQEKVISQLAKENKVEANPEKIQEILHQMIEGTNPSENQNTDKVKHRVTQQFLATSLFNHINKSTKKPTEKQIEDYYKNHPQEFVQKERIRIQQIIVKSLEEANIVLSRVRDGETFEELNKKYSAMPQNSLNGDTGFISRGMFPENMEETIYRLSKGDIGPIIQTKQGFHIVKILDKSSERTLPLEEVKKFISANLYQQEKELHYNKWLQEKILQTNIERNHALLQQNIPLS